MYYGKKWLLLFDQITQHFKAKKDEATDKTINYFSFYRAKNP